MNAIILLESQPSGTPAGYVTGALIALLILVYLVYTLIKPEKF